MAEVGQAKSCGGCSKSLLEEKICPPTRLHTEEDIGASRKSRATPKARLSPRLIERERKKELTSLVCSCRERRPTSTVDLEVVMVEQPRSIRGEKRLRVCSGEHIGNFSELENQE
ncbi:hypothetical protein ATANTOWER_022698 [Ataeniobius toweri]|uniref:Uncharacterized protein n=1 Tax=Ataeniobius toweri TaxID=208326 RepID=A0ABU7A2N8_9TELE|nr:hypothetical protein [Ataeniobius toweri]